MTALKSNHNIHAVTRDYRGVKDLNVSRDKTIPLCTIESGSSAIWTHHVTSNVTIIGYTAGA